jgi:hypothetical protein
VRRENCREISFFHHHKIILLKKFVFYLLAFLLLLVGGFFLGELSLRLIDTVNPKSTWLQMDERGFMKNIPDRNNLHTLGDIQVRYHFSSLGTRGKEPDSADTNIFVFGDSFTFGLFLPEEHTFINRLNDKSDSNITFINAGVGGTGLADWVAQLEVNLQDGNFAEMVDGVMIVANYDDFARALSKNLYVISEDSTLVASKRWEERAVKKWLDKQDWFVTLQEHSRIVSALHSLLWSWYYVDVTAVEESKFEVPDVWHEKDEKAFAEYTKKLSELLVSRLYENLREYQIPLYITTTGYLTEGKLTQVNRAGFEGFKTGIQENEIPFVDITEYLNAQIDGAYDSITIPGDSHPDSTGAALIAQEMVEQFLPLTD